MAEHRALVDIINGQRTKMVIFNNTTKDIGQLIVKGFSLEEVWEHLIEQIALPDEEESIKLTLIERLRLKERKERIIREIQKLENAAWKEPQPKKKYNLYTRMQKYKIELEDLENG